jgi:hypothetical protein
VDNIVAAQQHMIKGCAAGPRKERKKGRKEERMKRRMEERKNEKEKSVLV